MASCANFFVNIKILLNQVILNRCNTCSIHLLHIIFMYLDYLKQVFIYISVKLVQLTRFSDLKTKARKFGAMVSYAAGSSTSFTY